MSRGDLQEMEVGTKQSKTMQMQNQQIQCHHWRTMDLS
jgi:hypothetical protein